LCYAAIAEKHERNEEALGVLLRLVVANQTHRGGKKLLAKVGNVHNFRYCDYYEVVGIFQLEQRYYEACSEKTDAHDYDNVFFLLI
jgi:hypothetical protein